ncbi:MAG: hypothetical protein L0Y79_10825 [Chlorobi bacterium]|nr:hypothetical protein [Chlorobiota bacterium]
MKKIAILSAFVALLVSFAFFYSNSTASTASVEPSGSGVARTGLTISWDAVSGASYYNAKVDDDPAFSSPELMRLNHTSTSFQQGTEIGDVDPLNASTQFNIEVRAFNSLGQQIDLQTGSFTTGN